MKIQTKIWYILLTHHQITQHLKKKNKEEIHYRNIAVPPKNLISMNTKLLYKNYFLDNHMNKNFLILFKTV